MLGKAQAANGPRFSGFGVQLANLHTKTIHSLGLDHGPCILMPAVLPCFCRCCAYLPLHAGPFQNLTCADRHLAGLSSPKVAGVDVTPLSINAASNQGHNKRVAIIPQGFNWTLTTAWSSSRLPVCVKYWTDWTSRSPYSMRTV
jgi:hypothetical protein